MLEGAQGLKNSRAKRHTKALSLMRISKIFAKKGDLVSAISNVNTAVDTLDPGDEFVSDAHMLLADYYQVLKSTFLIGSTNDHSFFHLL